MATTSGEPAEPPWLSAEEQLAWLALLSVVRRLDGALDAQLRRDAGISHFEYVVLAVLSQSPEHTKRMSDLAAMADGSLSRLSMVVSRLERKGWVRRTPDSGDGRYTLAILTDDGLDQVIAAAPGHVRQVRRLVFDPLTAAQVRQLTSIGQRITHAIEAENGCRADSPGHEPTRGASEAPPLT